DPARAIVEAAHAESVDTVVVGNLGMAGRKEFLLGNVPNRVSHNARCTVIIVNTAGGNGQVTAVRMRARTDEPAPVPGEGRLLSRATEIAAVMARHGLKELFSRGTDAEDTTRSRARRLRTALEELGP